MKFLNFLIKKSPIILVCFYFPNDICVNLFAKKTRKKKWHRALPVKINEVVLNVFSMRRTKQGTH